MTKRVLIQFPGLGAYLPGVLTRLVADAPHLAAILDEVDQVAADYRLDPVSAPLTDPGGPDIDELARTPARLHMACFCAAYVLYEALRARGIDGDVLLGQSTGEITALAAGGALTVTDAARVLGERERAVEEANIAGGLVAVRAGSARARQLCGAAGGLSLQVSLSNSPDQSVVSGREQDLPRLEAVARAAGVQATRLLVRYPHHNAALRSAAQRLAAVTASYSFRDPVARIYSPILGRFVTSAADAHRIVDRHLCDPVHYLDAIRTLYDDIGIREFLEVGARSVLTDPARESLPATATLLSPPPNATDAGQILEALTGTIPVQLPPHAAVGPAPVPVHGPASQPAAPLATATASGPGSPPAPAANGGLSSRPAPAADSPATPQPIPTATSAAGRRLPDRDTLLSRLRVVFAEALGYPEDVFTDDAHLEADLGIASVKKTELLVGLLDEYQLPTPPAHLRMRDYSTLPKLAALMQTLAADEATA